jgi:hypothetical protein
MDHTDCRMSHPPLLIAPAYRLFAEPSCGDQANPGSFGVQKLNRSTLALRSP